MAREEWSEFHVYLERAELKVTLGFQCQSTSGGYQVTEVYSEGVVAEYNRKMSTAPPEFRRLLVQGDLITNINGHTELREMLHQIFGRTNLHLKVKRFVWWI